MQLVRLDPSQDAELLTTKSACARLSSPSPTARNHPRKSNRATATGQSNHKQTGCVVTDHSRTLDAYETLKLRKAGASERSNMERTLSKILGSIERKWRRRPLCHHLRSRQLAALPCLASLIASTVSWNSNSFGIRNGMVTFLQVSTVLFQTSASLLSSFGRRTATRPY
jgi:hypothetical protein